MVFSLNFHEVGSILACPTASPFLFLYYTLVLALLVLDDIGIIS